MTDADKVRACQGKYYSLSTEVWETVYQSFVGGYQFLFDCRQGKKNPYYRRLLARIGLDEMPREKSRGDSVGQSTNRSRGYQYQHRRIDLQGARKKDMFGVINGEDAHQAPDAPDCCQHYGPILQAIMGKDIEGLEMNELERAYHIVAKEKSLSRTKLPSREHMLKQILRYIAVDAPSSVKNLPINCLRMPGPHGETYDVNPSLITIPCCDTTKPDWMFNWKPGQAYSILVIASDEATYEAMIGAKPLIHNGTDCTVSTASPEELRCSTFALQRMVKAHAELLSGSRPGGVVSPTDYGNTNWDHVSVTGTFRGNTVQVPSLKGHGHMVLKLTLSGTETQYHIPDPMLVLMKGAINWYYTVTKEKLLPGWGEPGESLQKESEEEHGWINKESMFELHEEVLQEVYEESIHPQSMEDLARGLGQWTPSSP